MNGNVFGNTVLENVCKRWVFSNIGEDEYFNKNVANLMKLVRSEPFYKKNIITVFNEPAPENCKNLLAHKIGCLRKAEKMCEKLIEIMDKKSNIEEDFNNELI